MHLASLKTKLPPYPKSNLGIIFCRYYRWIIQGLSDIPLFTTRNLQVVTCLSPTTQDPYFWQAPAVPQRTPPWDLGLREYGYIVHRVYTGNVFPYSLLRTWKLRYFQGLPNIQCWLCTNSHQCSWGKELSLWVVGRPRVGFMAQGFANRAGDISRM